MSLFLEILAIVLPVFLVIALGYGLRRFKLIDAAFLFQTNRLVYYVALPLLLFYKIGTADFAANFNGALVAGSVVAVVIIFIISYGWAALRHYPPPIRGTFSQGAFRGNLAYVGLAVAMNAYGVEGFTRAGILTGFLVPVLNFLAITALLLPHRSAENRQGGAFWLRQIALNPLILASFAGIAWSFLRLPLPMTIDRTLDIATGMSLPLALLAIGGSFSLERMRGDLVTAALASALKLAVLPLLTVAILLWLGVSGIDLGIGLIIAGTPAATANYIMSDQMGGDAELAGTIIMLSTLFSALSYTVGLLLLRGFGL
jgi:predicted permease